MNLLVCLVEYTVVSIGRQLSYLSFPSRYLRELRGQVEGLLDVRKRIMLVVEEARRDGCEIEAVVMKWLVEAEEMVAEVDYLFEISASHLNLRRRYQLSRKAKKMLYEVVELKGKAVFGRVGYLPYLDTAAEYSTFATSRDVVKLESRESIENDILQCLKDTNESIIIGVYGLRGMGKTTLVKQVAQYAIKHKLFDVVVMATVSDTPNLRRIQGEIADQLNLRFDVETSLGRAHHLHERIKQERNLLVILDDIRERLNFEELGIPSHNQKGCKVLLTCRNQHVLHNMDTNRNFRLEALDEKETWSLFEAVAGNAVQDPILRSIAIKMAKRSGGLPAVAITMVEELRNKDIHSWKDALTQLNKGNNKEMNEIVYSALDLDTISLERDKRDQVFLLCSVIENNIPIHDLLKYVLGLGIVEGLNSTEEARNALHRMINALKASCLLLEDDATNAQVIRMHDVIREVAMSVASRDYHILTIKQDAKLREWPSEDLLQRCPQIILHCDYIQKLPERLDCPMLELLYLNSGNNRTLKIPNSFFEGMGRLKVLHLTSFNMIILPTSLPFLTQLKTLCFHHCALGNIEGIGELKNLIVLSLFHSSLEKFPGEIVQLTNLKMLDMSGSGIEDMPSNVLSNFIGLEELYMDHTCIKREVKTSVDVGLSKLLRLRELSALELQIEDAGILRVENVEKLERYKIVIGDVWEWSDSDKYGTFKMLKLELGTNIHLEHGVKALIERTEDLYLDEIDGVSNVLYQLSGDGFPVLQHLHIQNNTKFQHIVNLLEKNPPYTAFPKLETLILQNLSKLERICHGPFVANSFGKLGVIKVKSCDRLKYLLLYSTVKGLPQLVEIEVSGCNSMKMIMLVLVNDEISVDKIDFSPLRVLTLQNLPMIDYFCCNELMSSELQMESLSSRTNIPKSLFSSKTGFPNLETLKLSSINLNKFWEDDNFSAYSISMHNLANLIVEDCGSLEYLFSSVVVVMSLSNLKRLEISQCHMLEQIINTLGGRDNVFASRELEEVQVIFPKLETIIIRNMQNLKTIWDPSLSSNFLGKLKMLEVTKCDKLENIFPSYMQRSIGSLDTLIISDCESIEEIFQIKVNEIHNAEGNNNTVQLRRLTLLRLPKLKQIWSEDPLQTILFHNLQDVCVENCENMGFLFPFSIAKKLVQLEKLTVKSCGMKEIVAKIGQEDRIAIFPFHRLTSLVLWNLHKLERLYAGNHAIACPSLKEMSVLNCQKLNLYKTYDGSNQLSNFSGGGEMNLSMQQPLFTVEKVIPYLEELTINYKDVGIIKQGQFPGELFNKLKFVRLNNFEDEHATFVDWLLPNVPRLEWLIVQDSLFKQIFQDENVSGKGRLEMETRLKKLTLSSLPELQHICEEGFEIDPVFEVLEYLHLTQCSSLMNLVPSYVQLSHLVFLEVENCKKLTSLITMSTARSLVKLTTVKIRGCDSLEEIVMKEEFETQNEIVFGSLKILEMECLPRLTSFCSTDCALKFPLLHKVVVRQCPKMKIFSVGETSTPMLKKILVKEEDEEWCWEGDLNATVNKIFAKNGGIS